MAIVNKTVKITPNEPPFVDPFNLQLTFNDSGEIFFDIDDAAEEFKPPRGIVFQPGAPYTFVSFAPKQVVYSYDNNNPAETRIEFPYKIEFVEEGIRLPGEDPTVENDPPHGDD